MGLILVIGIMIVSLIVQQRLKHKFKKYSKVGLQNGLSGKEVAELMLRDNGITDVQILSVQGRLTDHYNPLKLSWGQIIIIRLKYSLFY